MKIDNPIHKISLVISEQHKKLRSELQILLLLYLQVFNLEIDCKPGRSAKAYGWSETSLPALIQKEVESVAIPVIRSYRILNHRRLNTSTLLIVTTSGTIRLEISLDRGGIARIGTCPCAYYLNPFIYGSDWG